MSKPGPKDIELHCPGCGLEILVDTRTGKIMRHGDQKKPEETLDDIVKRERERDKDPDKKLDAAMGEMEKRKDELEDAFKKAKKKAEEEGPIDPQADPFRWD